ncbi:MAG: hypothetical protein Q4B71_00340 [Cardiobacteriaceae bacterium]|nr:hypothetical protein [Cardiobacteriaceae bacterium]
MTHKELSLGDLLKSESDPNQRQSALLEGVKIGELVAYQEMHLLVALSNSEHGKVLIQPSACVVDLSHLRPEHLKMHGSLNPQYGHFNAEQPQDLLQKLLASGTALGITYIGVEKLQKRLEQVQTLPQPSPPSPPQVEPPSLP